MRGLPGNVARRLAASVIAGAMLALVAGSLRLVLAQPALDAPAPAAASAELAAVRFAAIDVYLETEEPLAAWQFELDERAGAMAVVGIENGDSAAFAGTPYYDRAAVDSGLADRIIVADYSLGESDVLPSGRTRVATVHVRLDANANPDFDLRLIAAGNAEGRPIAAEARYELQNGR